jgi:hypothetical protein
VSPSKTKSIHDALSSRIAPALPETGARQTKVEPFVGSQSLSAEKLPTLQSKTAHCAEAGVTTVPLTLTHTSWNTGQFWKTQCPGAGCRQVEVEFDIVGVG